MVYVTPDSLFADDTHHLWIGGVRIADLASQYGTPLYVMDETTMKNRIESYLSLLANLAVPTKLFYAGKAFLCTAMAQWLRHWPVGLDVVSGGELYTALAGGFDPEAIIFHGNVKTVEEIRYAIAAGVRYIVVDSLAELALIESEGARLDRQVQILLRLTPGIDAHTHAFIRTGQFDSKFGFGMADGISDQAVAQALSSDHIELAGFHAHVGSQILEEDPFLANAQSLLDYAQLWHRRSGWWPTVLDIGGGFGVRYGPADEPPELTPIFHRIAEAMIAMTPKGCAVPELAIEPGRSIVGEAGVTLYRVGATKFVPGGKQYVAVDGGMGDNIRPALYQASYRAAVDGRSLDDTASAKVTVAGRYCESGDILLADVILPTPEVQDILVTYVTGAYNYSMASNYNRVPRPAVVLVSEGTSQVWVERESWQDLTRLDRLHQSEG